MVAWPSSAICPATVSITSIHAPSGFSCKKLIIDPLVGKTYLLPVLFGCALSACCHQSHQRVWHMPWPVCDLCRSVEPARTYLIRSLMREATTVCQRMSRSRSSRCAFVLVHQLCIQRPSHGVHRAAHNRSGPISGASAGPRAGAWLQVHIEVFECRPVIVSVITQSGSLSNIPTRWATLEINPSCTHNVSAGCSDIIVRFNQYTFDSCTF